MASDRKYFGLGRHLDWDEDRDQGDRDRQDGEADFAVPIAQREMLARRCVQHLVLAAQGSLMLQHAPSWAAQSFIASRIDAACGRMYGTLADEQMQWKVLERAWPV